MQQCPSRGLDLACGCLCRLRCTDAGRHRRPWTRWWRQIPARTPPMSNRELDQRRSRGRSASGGTDSWSCTACRRSLRLLSVVFPPNSEYRLRRWSAWTKLVYPARLAIAHHSRRGDVSISFRNSSQCCRNAGTSGPPPDGCQRLSKFGPAHARHFLPATTHAEPAALPGIAGARCQASRSHRSVQAHRRFPFGSSIEHQLQRGGKG